MNSFPNKDIKGDNARLVFTLTEIDFIPRTTLLAHLNPKLRFNFLCDLNSRMQTPKRGCKKQDKHFKAL